MRADLVSSLDSTLAMLERTIDDQDGPADSIDTKKTN
jgi:hypothetical protein